MHDSALLILSTILFAYLCGSIPFGLILTKMAGLGDIRSIGSGNIGATNVLRTGNKKIAAAVLLLDGLKGYLAVVIVQFVIWRILYDRAQLIDYVEDYDWRTPLENNVTLYVLIAGLSAILGHLYPIWLKFKGGKGVATAIGAYFAIAPMLGLVVVGVWLLVFVIFRISSLAALCGFFAVALYLNTVTFVPALPIDYFLIYSVIIMALIFWRHKENIKRLRAGTEPRFGSKK